MKPRLPTDPTERKKIPLAAVWNYFDLALIEVAKVIYGGNAQHNPGSKEMIWDRSKSTDQEECLQRHFLDRGTLDTDGLRHTAKMAWRALAMLQLEMEAALAAEPSRASVNIPREQQHTFTALAKGLIDWSPRQLELPFGDDKPSQDTSPTIAGSVDGKVP